MTFYPTEGLVIAQVLKSWYPWIKLEFDHTQHKYHCFQQKYLKAENGLWKTVPFDYKGWRYMPNLFRYPITANLFDVLPIYENLSFSVLEPGTRIPPHEGHSGNILRVHLGIHTNRSAAIRVGSDTYSWRDGEVMIFEDHKNHEAWNLGTEDRVILLFDILKQDLR